MHSSQQHGGPGGPLSRFTQPDGSLPPLAGGDGSTDTRAKVRDRLTRIEDQKIALREQRKTAAAEADSAKLTYAGTDLKPGSAEFEAAKKAVGVLGQIDDQLAAWDKEHIQVLELIGDGPRGATDHEVPPFAQAGGWNSQALLADDRTVATLSEMSSSTMRVGRMHLGQVVDRDTLAAAMAADATGTTNMRRGAFHGVVPQLRRQLSLLDLLPVGTMDSRTLPYTQEAGSLGTALETAEGDLKPEASVTFTDAEAIAATIAHWSKVRKQALADLPAMKSIIDGRLRYGVERRLQDEIVAGDGIGENMRGILNTTGIGVVPFAAGELVADQILRGITTVFLSDAEANAIVLHPLDWESALRAKAAGDGHYYSGGPFSITPQVMWGVPLLPSAAVAQGTALVGDFAVGTQLFIREGVIVLVSDSDEDDFRRNKVTLLAEMRAALAVWRPAAFTTVALA